MNSNNKYGPDTKELLRRIANIKYNELYLCNLNITSLPEFPIGLTGLDCSHTQLTILPKLPAGLKKLDCSHTQLTILPKLPTGLTKLKCRGTQLTSLPELPAGLTYLDCCFTQLTSLPELPVGLTYLDCSNTQLTSLPELPVGLKHFWYHNCLNLIIKRLPYESIRDYNQRWNNWREQASKMRIQQRNQEFKEDLIAEFWKPSRVEKMLDTGGWDLVDSY